VGVAVFISFPFGVGESTGEDSSPLGDETYLTCSLVTDAWVRAPASREEEEGLDRICLCSGLVNSRVVNGPNFDRCT
jgi:hypothetical protein